MTLLRARLQRAQVIGSGNDARSATGRGSAIVPFTLPHPGDCSDARTLTIAIFDDSGSVAGLGGNDPISLRYQEAGIAFRHLANACACGHEFGAVLHFDHPSGCDVPPVRLDGRRGLRQIERGLREPPGEFGTSDLGPSLAAAKVMAERFNGDHVTLMVFSDFMLTDADPASVYATMETFPGLVCNMVLAATVPQELVDIPNGRLREIPADAESGAVAQVILQGLTEHRLGADTRSFPSGRTYSEQR
ncbi:hypothetical protein [Nocardia sp. alder85J]|uniref:hypothetical protein n=1 Tax=Nocardia sp. alder85J TaxID=2862949 RepID=UPI001CD6CCF9|nr:hypothetical protein [Nocardia sp. alder85J]MCX4098053.1 hypothetical protein [Nocardia sp. alder85J]